MQLRKTAEEEICIIVRYPEDSNVVAQVFQDEVDEVTAVFNNTFQYMINDQDLMQLDQQDLQKDDNGPPLIAINIANQGSRICILLSHEGKFPLSITKGSAKGM